MSWFEWFCVNLLLIGVAVFLLVRLFSNNVNIWKELGIPYNASLGNVVNFVMGKENIVTGSFRAYNQFPNERFYGGYSFSTTPTLTIKDPELLEKILVKDFSNFHDRNPDYFADFEYTDQHLGNVNGLVWKNLRNKLTPTFTSGKLKGMMEQFLICSESLLEHLKTHTLNEPIELTNIIQGFTIDVIASCAFGLDTQTLNEKNSAFKKNSLEAFRPNFLNRLLLSAEPLQKLAIKLSKWKPSESSKFFKDTVMDTVNYRKANNVNRNDYLSLLIELFDADMRLVAEGKVDPDEPGLVNQRSVVSNSFLFLVAGFETTATTLTYLLYELCMHQDIQEKTYREISNTLKSHESKITYEAIKEMKYLRQVIDETLRKYPPIGFTNRTVSIPYSIPDTGIVLPRGMVVEVPIYGLHHDSRYFPEPEKFVPERFSKENQHKIGKMTYMPFGDGPRMCIGTRFALLEISVATCQILMKYKLLKCDKTTDNIEFAPSSFAMSPKDSIWASLQPR